MKQFDLEHKIHIFFSGIGGISMSGMAHLLLDRGFQLSGSDTMKSDLTVALVREGAKIYYGQSPENITEDIDLVVHSAAIHRDNPELMRAEAMGLPIMTRAEFLGALMANYEIAIGISGTHGKTTTTSMVSDIFLSAGLNPTISVGGIMPSFGGNFKIGGSKYFITEACEYTNSFWSFYPDCAVILNCELDHTDFFKDEEDFRASFRRYAQNVRPGGKVIIHRAIRDIDYFKNPSATMITFGVEDNADYCAKNVRGDAAGQTFDLYRKGTFIEQVRLNMPGAYNVPNALAAIAAAMEYGLPLDVILLTLSRFHCAQRRFEILGETNGVTVISEFAHHPTAIRYALETARLLQPKKLWTVFQPHAYSRTKEFLHEFADVLSASDAVVLVPIYAAREVNTYNIYSEDIARILKDNGVETYCCGGFGEAEDVILTHARPGDAVMAMGGGDIDKVAKDLMGIGYTHGN
ncbi:MAG: UDP-N-acetylmuramate--L-alanine ligase [Eubacteriales bacterium]|nr:UDP-N-acetylmuramate--L-alanine ligase [Eubacteriales bacterium]